MHRRAIVPCTVGPVLLVCSLYAPGVVARCEQPALITTIESTTFYSYVYTPGVDHVTGVSSSMGPTAGGFFWALGAGDPVVGQGIDNGAFPVVDGPYGGWLSLPYGYPAYILTSWAVSIDIDDCVDASPQDPTCTAILLTDEDGAGGGFFKLLTKAPNLTRDYLFNQADNAPIELAPLPTPVVAAFDGEFATIDAPDLPPDGFLLDPVCSTPAPGDAVVGYKIYWQVHEPDTPVPVDRRRDEGGWLPAFGGTLPNGDPLPLGVPALIEIGCRPRTVYLATSLVFDSGFETQHVSANGGPFPACDCAGTDADGDGYCTESGTFQDCDDADATVFPDAPELCGDGVNNDCFDPIWPAPSALEVDADADGFDVCAGDCDDGDADVYPGAPPLCDFVNNDCSDPIWPALPAGELDVDRDGFRPCEGDCAPTINTVFPGAPELCDGRNNDCLHPEWPLLAGLEGIDDDGDGLSECDGDCYDFSLALGGSFRGEFVFPGAGELCDGIANDCDDPSWPEPTDESAGPDDDGDGFVLCPDCDDSRADVFPGAPQVCDGVNNDCDDANWPDPSDDEADRDLDGYSPCDGDCEDRNGNTYPGAPQLCDGVNNDCDDPEWPTVTDDEVDADGDGSPLCRDCDDANGAVAPGAPELCDGLNNDCNDPIWPDLPRSELDLDGDGQPPCGGDCDDANAAVFAGAQQLCDGVNTDCDDPLWPEVPSDEIDGDGDGFLACDECDDAGATVYPGAPELCDGLNNDCLDPDWPDASDEEVDGDGDGVSICDGDCNDDDIATYPGAPELCDGLNNDCLDPDWPDPSDEDTDADGDGLSICDGDCNDDDIATYPGAPEICDGTNNDCSDPNWPALPEEEMDGDGDSAPACADCDDADPRVYPLAPQVCDGLNNDCLDPSFPDLEGTNEFDDDNDGFTECAGDCADDDPLRNPGIDEDCENGIDDDCDGRSDGADRDCDPLFVSLESFTATVERGGVRLRWKTVSETDSVGFHLLRGKSRGRLVAITPRLIPARGSGLGGAEYEYLDSVRHRAGLVYYLEEIDRKGVVTRYGPALVIDKR